MNPVRPVRQRGPVRTWAMLGARPTSQSNSESRRPSLVPATTVLGPDLTDSMPEAANANAVPTPAYTPMHVMTELFLLLKTVLMEADNENNDENEAYKTLSRAATTSLRSTTTW